ncbi:MAG: hypothetical protein ACRDQA_02475 [Nocardioidaceae bacterium]
MSENYRPRVGDWVRESYEGRVIATFSDGGFHMAHEARVDGRIVRPWSDGCTVEKIAPPTLRPEVQQVNRERAPGRHMGQPPTRYVNTRTGKHRWRLYGRRRPRGDGWVCDDGDTCRLDSDYDPYPKQTLYLDERARLRDRTKGGSTK